MCLVIAQFSENPNEDDPFFIMAENRDENTSRLHTENHITPTESWPDVGDQQTWFGTTAETAIALLNYYPNEKAPEKGTKTRGLVVPQLLRMNKPAVSEIKELKEITAFQVLIFSRKCRQLVWQVWDGKNLKPSEIFESGSHAFASSSYGVEIQSQREAHVKSLIQENDKLTKKRIEKILASTKENGEIDTTTPCMKGSRSQTIASHVVQFFEDRTKITGFAGLPSNPETQNAFLDHTIPLNHFA